MRTLNNVFILLTYQKLNVIESIITKNIPSAKMLHARGQILQLGASKLLANHDLYLAHLPHRKLYSFPAEAGIFDAAIGHCVDTESIGFINDKPTDLQLVICSLDKFRIT